MASNQPAEESIAKRRSGTHQGVTDTAHAASVAGLTLRTEVPELPKGDVTKAKRCLKKHMRPAAAAATTPAATASSSGIDNCPTKGQSETKNDRDQAPSFQQPSLFV
ncbi:hypothetical protein PCG10_001308 [Penicillium crustosum]|uniref:Uncharacterized protein n=1 Tax=Penicillium crustosum TaxID=36656 RepID=A0A9P5KWR5_PENCR|nr:uncharacterized protein N7487_010477 [Penicillium crustosum]KAF7517293.1 hypothetical protein PCG10_001308 [Penicillium crustosum]KAJ5396174.1 hypothetical protein N7487_010477 [Penicillium crustosum]